VDIPENDLAALNCLSKEKNVSRAGLVRHAIAQYLERYGPKSGSKGFGLWKESPVDALSHQRRMRNEWQR
jgi:hypothetical protein